MTETTTPAHRNTETTRRDRAAQLRNQVVYELIATRAVNATPRKTGISDALAAAELPTELRPRRARLRPEG